MHCYVIQSVDTKVRSKVCPAEESLLDENVSLIFAVGFCCASFSHRKYRPRLD